MELVSDGLDSSSNTISVLIINQLTTAAKF